MSQKAKDYCKTGFLDNECSKCTQIIEMPINVWILLFNRSRYSLTDSTTLSTLVFCRRDIGCMNYHDLSHCSSYVSNNRSIPIGSLLQVVFAQSSPLVSALNVYVLCWLYFSTTRMGHSSSLYKYRAVGTRQQQQQQ